MILSQIHTHRSVEVLDGRIEPPKEPDSEFLRLLYISQNNPHSHFEKFFHFNSVYIHLTHYKWRLRMQRLS